MPRQANYYLCWQPKMQAYRFQEKATAALGALLPETEAWYIWLDEGHSFAFSSRTGAYCTVRRERVKRHAAYWYAYRFLHGRAIKRYLGRTRDLTLARLEEAAALLAAEREEPSVEVPALLASKLTPPRLPALLVDRSRLMRLLDRSLSCPVTLLQAPAGFGKTTAVRQWISKERIPVAWISLESGDNDPVRFWRYLITACQTFEPNIGQMALRQLATVLHPPVAFSSTEAFVTSLLNELSAGARGLLVLDDYHAITSPQIHEMLTFFLDHLPPSLHVLIVTRSEPPLPRVSWRAKGLLAELQHTDLRFSMDETATFLLQALSLPLSERALRQLDALLAGWPAGLRLLTLALQQKRTKQELEQAIQAFSERANASLPQALLDYAVTEIVSALPEPLQHFLFQTCAFARLSAPLCDAVTGRANSAALLEELERAGLFLEVLDQAGTWYRYHALFAEALRTEAIQRYGEEAQQAVLLRAQRWYETHGLLAEAIETSLLVGDGAHAAQLIEQLEAQNGLDEPQTLSRWFARIPDSVLFQYPILCFFYALVLRFPYERAPVQQAEQERIEELLQMAEATLSEQNDTIKIGVLYAFRALSALEQEPFTEAVRHARRALELFPPEVDDQDMFPWIGTCQIIVGLYALFHGRYDEALNLAQQARLYAVRCGDQSLLRGTLLVQAACSSFSGELYQAREYYQQVLTLTRAHRDEEHRAEALTSLAALLLEWNEPEQAEQLVQEALQLTKLSEPQRHSAELRLAHVMYARGRLQDAQQQLESLLARLRLTLSPWDVWQMVGLLCLLGRLYLRMQEYEGVRRCLELLARCEQQQGEVVLTKLLEARLLLAQGQVQGARLLLEQVDRVHTPFSATLEYLLRRRVSSRPSNRSSGRVRCCSRRFHWGAARAHCFPFSMRVNRLSACFMC